MICIEIHAQLKEIFLLVTLQKLNQVLTFPYDFCTRSDCGDTNHDAEATAETMQ